MKKLLTMSQWTFIVFAKNMTKKTCTTTNIVIPSVKPFYLTDRGYPDPECACSVEVYSLQPIQLVILLAESLLDHPKCSENLTVTDGANATFWNFTYSPDSKSNEVGEIIETSSNYVLLTHVDQFFRHGKPCVRFAIGFQAIEHGAKMSINCPSKNQTDCGKPSSITHGNVTYSKTTYGGIATYTCVTGYTVSSGNDAMVCGETGSWNGTLPECSLVECGTPPNIDLGKAVYTNRTYGSNVTYVCDVGANMDNARGPRTCLSNGTWGGEASTCSLVDCGTPRNIDLAKAVYKNTTYGSNVTYVCDVGANMDNDRGSRKCLSNGTWGGEASTCSLVDCGTPRNIDLAKADYTNTTYGSNVTYVCDVGANMDNDRGSRTCLSNGTWGGEASTCSLVDCGTPRKIALGKAVYKNTTYDSNVTYVCDVGANMDNDRGPRTCLSNGTWGGEASTCSLVDCGTPRNIDLAKAVYKNTTYGSNVTYVCDVGANMDNDRGPRTCLSNGTWGGEASTCSLVDCSTPANIPHGKAVYTNTTYSSDVKYVCDVGANMSINGGPKTCMSNGMWGGEASICTLVDCRSPPNIPHGTAVYTDTTYGNNFTYTCNVGANMDNDRGPRTCLTNGTWGGEASTCSLVECSNLDAINNSHIEKNGTVFGSIATYSCDLGYYLDSGYETRTCGADGHWTGIQPSCQIKDCGRLIEPSNGNIVYTGTTYGSVATYDCVTGYHLTSGSTERTCQADGVWKGSRPSCTIVDCGSPTAPNNGMLNTQNPAQTTYNTMVKFHCVKGYILNGDATLRCLADGSWSDPHDSCQDESSESSTVEPWVYYGVIPAVCVLVLIVVIVCIVKSRRRSDKYKAQKARENVMGEGVTTDKERPELVNGAA